MSTVVVVPWWPGTPQHSIRYRWRDQVVALWVERGYEVVLGVGIEGAARNRGVEDAVRLGADTIIVCDADSVITDHQARWAVAMANTWPGLVIPHDRYVYLSRSACRGLTVVGVDISLTEGDGRWVTDQADGIEFSGDLGVGGPQVFTVATWEQAGGYDEKIVRAYDQQFALACGTLVGEQRRLEGDYVHLWHPRSANEDDEAWPEIAKFHLAAKQGPEAMRSLIERRKA